MNRIFSAVFTHAPVGMAIINQDGSIVIANSYLRLLLSGGQDGKIPVHGLLENYIHPGDRDDFRLKFSGFVKGRDPELYMEAGSGRDSGLRLSLSFSSVPHPDKNGAFILVIINDITRRVETESRLQREREESLTAREDALKATRTKSEFLANMSHEIRTPIHTIIGTSELMLDTALDAGQQEYATQIQYSAEVLLGLINDILDFTKIEAGQLNLENIPFDLASLAEESVHLVALQAHKKGLEAVTRIPKNIPRRLIGDPLRIRQVIVNLFNNAIKFTHQGSITVSLELVEQDDVRASVICRVADTGIGIASEDMNRLFKVFSQVDSSTSRKFGGSGLGLSISRNLVSMMGGEIGVDSSEGRGTTFWFTLDLPKEADLSLYDDLTDEFFVDTTVLLVDDSLAARDALKAYLRDWGVTVCECGSAEAAIDFLKAEKQAGRKVDIAIIDQSMPGVDGWQLASQINADREINDIQLVLLTPAGHSGDEARMKLMKWFNAYLYKPVRRRELFDVLFRLSNADMELESVDDLNEDDQLSDIFSEEKGSILVAEDHEVNQQLFKSILESMGYRVVLAANGLEAVEVARKGECALIFMDVQMPEMNGYEATSEIRRLDIDTPIIAVTASAIKGEREKCLDLGMNDFLAKPFKKKDIEPILYKWGTARVTAHAGIHEGSDLADKEVECEVFDFAEAVSTFMGKKDVVIKLLESFIPHVERQIPVLKEALSRGDYETLQTEVHGLKGSSWNILAKRLGNRALELEESAREKQANSCAVNLMGVEDAFDEFKRAARIVLLKNCKNQASGCE